MEMSLTNGTLCTGLISSWLGFAGSSHRHAVDLCLGTCTKLLHQSAVSFIPIHTIFTFLVGVPSVSQRNHVMHI